MKSTFVALAIFAILYKLTKPYFLTKDLKKIPGSNAGLLGRAWELMMIKDQNKTWLLDMTKKYGKTWRFQNFDNHIVCVTTPENVQHILKDKAANYIKGPGFTTRFEELLGDGIFNTNGESWNMQRKVASKIFTGANFNSFFAEVFLKNSRRLVDILDDYAANPTQAVDMQKLYFNFTLESIGEIGFGVELGCMSDKPSPFSNAFDTAQSLCVERFFDPTWQVARMLQLGSKARQMTEAIETMNDFSQKVISERRDEIKERGLFSKQGRADLLSLFIEAGEKTKAKNKAVAREVSDLFLRDMIINMVIAGRDTTACTLTWATYLLSQYPEVEAKLMEEIRAKLEAGEKPTAKALAPENMPFLHGVVSETLRLYPPVPMDPKFAVADDTLPDGTFIPRGCEVQYNPYCQNRDPDLWERPLEYDPGRWIDAEGRSVPVSPYVFPVFQAGPRLCLGQRMAYFEAKLLLTMILRSHKFTLKPGTDVQPNHVSITLSVEGALPMLISRREE